MTAPLLSELREPPVVGRFYMVPVIIDYPYHGRRDTWPVLGPMHSDVEFFAFRPNHYHIDARFTSARQETLYTNAQSYSIEWIVQGYPLASHGEDVPKHRPVLRRLKCRRASYGYVYSAMDGVKALNRHYGAPAGAICRADGRKLCPHRKVDLSQFPADADGVVTCPLHGLRVRVS